MANPISFRIISVLGTHGKLTTEQIGEELSDVPVSTLYRHLSRLRAVDLINVVEERQARGTVERTYAVVPSNSRLQPQEVQTAPIAHVRAAFRNFIANLTANVLSYVDGRAFAKDRTQLRSFQAAAELTDEEYANVSQTIVDEIVAAKTRSTGGPTKRRLFYIIALPEASAQ